jgi:hypothetical protein
MVGTTTAYSHSMQPSSSSFSSPLYDDSVYLPELHHTGVVTNLQKIHGHIGKNIRKAVSTTYPSTEHRLVNSIKVADGSKPISSVTNKGHFVPPSDSKTKRNKAGGATGGSVNSVGSGSIFNTASNNSGTLNAGPLSPAGRSKKRNVVLVNQAARSDPYINSSGALTSTRVHDLVYSTRMAQPHSLRKTRYTEEILKKIKDDVQEFKTRIPI